MKFEEMIFGLRNAKEFPEHYEEVSELAIDLLERTRWIQVSERLPTEEDANSKGKIIAWCTSFNGTEVDLNWRLVETSGVITHWRVGMEPPQEVE